MPRATSFGYLEGYSRNFRGAMGDGFSCTEPAALFERRRPCLTSAGIDAGEQSEQPGKVILVPGVLGKHYRRVLEQWILPDVDVLALKVRDRAGKPRPLVAVVEDVAAHDSFCVKPGYPEYVVKTGVDCVVLHTRKGGLKAAPSWSCETRQAPEPSNNLVVNGDYKVRI